MKICILSDSHDNLPLLEAAARQAADRGAQAILHCGDVVAPSTLKVLIPLKLPVHVIHGNNTGDLWALNRISARSEGQIQYYGQDAGLDLGGRRIFLVHYPHYARAMATTGDWDIVCCGHSHKPSVQKIPNMKGGATTVINPGTVGGVGTDPATYIVGDLDRLQFELHQLEKRENTELSPETHDLFA